MMLPKLLLVVPCYNEQDILLETYESLNNYFNYLINQKSIDVESKICFVNDGSKDDTWPIIEGLVKQNNRIIGITLSRNFGHQNALIAGLFEMKNKFDCYISIDADLQDDINAIESMIEKYKEGCKVVYGVRNDRSSDSWFKRNTAQIFYKLMHLLKVPIVFNHADFRLIDNTVLNHFEKYGEVNLFLRGVFPTIGFKSDKVFYSRSERSAGESKYPFKKMILFAWEGVTSFSTVPMRFVLWFGILNFVIALGLGFYVIISKIYGITTSGWTSIVLPMAFFSGSNMIAIGLIGEYVGKIYAEVKHRPRYIVDKIEGIIV